MNKRNQGIDLFRCVAMLMVVMLHVLNHGGVLSATKPNTPMYSAAWLLHALGFCAVNCYALVSGYVGVGTEFRYRRIIPMWLQVTFYSVLITLLFAVISPELVDSNRVISSFFPVIHRTYWYFTMYFALFFLMPLFNHGIRALTQETAKKLLIGLLAVFSILGAAPYFNLLGMVITEDIFMLGEGFSVMWLALMYIVGGCIAHFGLGRRVPAWKLWAGFFACALAAWLFKLTVQTSESAQLKSMVEEDALLYYPSPLMAGAAVCLLLLFSRLETLPRMPGRVVKFFAPAAFSVYLIHEHPLVRSEAISGRFAAFTALSPGGMLLRVAVVSIGIFLLCGCIDQLRLLLFRLVKVRQLVDRIADYGRE